MVKHLLLVILKYMPMGKHCMYVYVYKIEEYTYTHIYVCIYTKNKKTKGIAVFPSSTGGGAQGDSRRSCRG